MQAKRRKLASSRRLSGALPVRRSRPHILLPLLCVFTLVACDPTKRIPEGSHLLNANHIQNGRPELNTDDLKAILKQKPNKRVLSMRWYLSAYNVPDTLKLQADTAAKHARIDAANERIQRANDTLPEGAKKQKLKTYHRTFWEWWREEVGEPPVLLDSSLTERSQQQLQLYLFKEGFFRAQVTDTVTFKSWTFWPFRTARSPKARPLLADVTYRLRTEDPWTICQVNLRVDDTLMASYIRQQQDRSRLRPGARFDGDDVDAERTRIADLLKEQGYLYFTRDMVLFDADTSAGDHQVDLIVRLERPAGITQRGLRGTPEGTVYYLNNVVIDATHRTADTTGLPPDTLIHEGYTILYRGRKPEFRSRTLAHAVFLRPDARFNQLDADRTFRRLTNLRVFDRVDITYDTTGLRRQMANCRIDLLPSKKQGITVEGFGTNRGGFLGTSVNFSYRHKNVFRSMAAFQFGLTLGLEAQQSLGSNSSSSDASTSLGKDALFNTVEIGPEASISFPLSRWFAKSSGARLVVNGLFNYQRRPDYTRTLAKGSLGLEWSPATNQTLGVYGEVNVIRIPKRSDAFSEFLATTNDAVLTNSYTDHVIVNIPRAAWTIRTREERQRRNNYFYRVSGELAGSVPRWLQVGHPVTDSSGSYLTLFGVRYAEYTKIDNDFRFYHTIHDKSSLAFRVLAGFAKPYGNLSVMPFETSFWAGGANDIRAWRARSLGPGSYYSTENNFDRIGELRLEGNAEYRFKVFGYLEGALFTDVGNIWLLEPNPAKPGGDFQADRFLSELAVGTGIGARLNFQFFIVRFDLGLQTRDPSLPVGQRWIFQPRDADYQSSFGRKLNFNLGIGYPF